MGRENKRRGWGLSKAEKVKPSKNKRLTIPLAAVFRRLLSSAMTAASSRSSSSGVESEGDAGPALGNEAAGGLAPCVSIGGA